MINLALPELIQLLRCRWLGRFTQRVGIIFCVSCYLQEMFCRTIGGVFIAVVDFEFKKMKCQSSWNCVSLGNISILACSSREWKWGIVTIAVFKYIFHSELDLYCIGRVNTTFDWINQAEYNWRATCRCQMRCISLFIQLLHINLTNIYFCSHPLSGKSFLESHTRRAFVYVRLCVEIY